MEVIHIYHTNDLHSHFEHWPRIHHFLTERKKWHQQSGEEVFIFDIGDHADRSHPMTEATSGKGNIELLNKAGYQAITIGNNEGITFPHEDLDHLYDYREFEVLVANLYNKDGTRPKWVKDHIIYETKNGTKLGVIGLTANYSKLYDLLGWQTHDPIEELQKQLLRIKEKETDILVLLSHLGIEDDEKIGHDFSEIDVVIGGHTHHIFHDGKLVDNTLLTCAGKYGMYIGHIMLTVDTDKGEIMDKKARLYDTNTLHTVVNEETEARELYQYGKEILDSSIVTLQNNYTSKEEIALLLCDAVKEWCRTDCAILNEGLILEELRQGKVTQYDLHITCPHPINPCVVILSGAELKEVLLQTLDKKWSDLMVIGLGFRGKVMGKMIYSGINFCKEKGHIQFSVNGEELNTTRMYSIAIPDMFTFGRFFPAIFRAKNKTYYLPEFMRHLLEWKLSKNV